MGSPPSAVVFFVGVIALMVVVGIVAARRDRRRKAALPLEAQQLGLTFEAESSATLARFNDRLRLFRFEGREARVANRISGRRDDLDVELFDFGLTIRAGGKRRWQEQTVVVVRVPGVPLPAFKVDVDVPFGKLIMARRGAAVPDLDFPDHPSFSRRYILDGDDQQAVRRLFTPAVIAWFEAATPLWVECLGDAVALYRWGTLVGPGECRARIDEALGLVRLLVAERDGAAVAGASGRS